MLKLSDEEKRLFSIYRELSERGKGEIIGQIRMIYQREIEKRRDNSITITKAPQKLQNMN